jgi:hypothetical protein
MGCKHINVHYYIIHKEGFGVRKTQKNWMGGKNKYVLGALI